jgi:hypothetical protein
MSMQEVPMEKSFIAAVTTLSLVVEPQQVVLGQTESADWCF